MVQLARVLYLLCKFGGCHVKVMSYVIIFLFCVWPCQFDVSLGVFIKVVLE